MLATIYIHLPPHIHTHAHLDLIVWLVPLDPLFDFTIYALQVCMCWLHTHELHISLIYRVRERRHNTITALVKIHKYHKLRDLRGSYKGISEFYFENLQKLRNKSWAKELETWCLTWSFYLSITQDPRDGWLGVTYA
jgi:hypothetical protein